MRTSTKSLCLAGALLLLFACGDDDSSSNNTNNTNNTNVIPDECTPYTPEESTDSVDINLATKESRQEFNLVAPDEPGGGYFTVKFTNLKQDLRYEADVTADADDQLVVEHSTDFSGEDLDLAFPAEPGAAFTVSTGFATMPPDSAVPESYTATWEWVPVVDCYEPNDSFAEAKGVVVEQPVRAFAFDGYIASDTDISELPDYYRVTIPTQGDWTVSFSEVPGDVWLSLQLLDMDQMSLAHSSNPADDTVLSTITVQNLPAGDYFLVVENNRNLTGFARVEGADLPSYFTNEYEFTISAQ